MADQYNSAHTGAEIDQAVSDVQNNKATWGSKPQPSDTTPKAPGTASAGSESAYARGNHVHPKQTVTKSDVGLGNVDNVKQYSATNPPPYPVTSVNGKTGAVKLTAEDVGASSQDDLVRLENLLIQIQDKLNQGTVVDNITVNDINNMIVEYFENKKVSEVEA